MSNKTLIIIIVVLLALFGGAIVYFQMSDKQVKGTGQEQSSQTAQTPPGSTALTGNDTAQPQPTASSTDQTANQGQAMNDCKRNFDENTLKTAKVDIKNRQVEMQVKGFGTIKLEFYDQDAPKAVENFLRLTNSGYYDCLTFHRVAKGFVIQGGDPNGTGTGGQSAFGTPFADELNAGTASYKAGYAKGVLAMANSGPNTNGSQFFIMLDTVPLDHNYTIFGKVIEGQDVVDKIGQVDITPQMGPTDGAPKQPVVMESVKITK